MFAVNVQRRLAGDYDLELGPYGEQVRYDLGSGDQMLKIVEQEKHRLVQPAKVVFHVFLRRLIAGLAHSHRLCDGGSDQARFPDDRQRNEANAGWKLLHDFACHLQSKSRLADTARTGEGHKPHIIPAQELAERSRLVLASDECGTRHREVAGARLRMVGGRIDQPVANGRQVAGQIPGGCVPLLRVLG